MAPHVPETEDRLLPIQSWGTRRGMPLWVLPLDLISLSRIKPSHLYFQKDSFICLPKIVLWIPLMLFNVTPYLCVEEVVNICEHGPWLKRTYIKMRRIALHIQTYFTKCSVLNHFTWKCKQHPVVLGSLISKCWTTNHGFQDVRL